MKTILVISGVIAAGLLVQYFRYMSKTKDIQNGVSLVLPMSYFPFNGSYINENGSISKS